MENDPQPLPRDGIQEIELELGMAGDARPLLETPPALPNYEILGELGRGGFGVVWKARDAAHDRMVAIKPVTGDPSQVEPFLRQARQVARLTHPGMVKVYGVAEHEGRHFILAEFIDGTTLGAAEKPMPWRRALRIVDMVARALAVAHEAGIVHRDIKPSNILFDKEGWPHLADFCPAAELSDGSGTGVVFGTPEYMSPEQAAGAETGPASDQWSLGVMLYELLTGRRPFTAGRDVAALFQVILKEDPVPPRRIVREIPRDVEAICLKMLEKDARRRYGSMRELAEDIGRCLVGEPLRGAGTRGISRLVRRAARRPLALFAGAVSVAAVLALGIVLFLSAAARRGLVAEGMGEASKLEAEGKLEEALLKVAAVLRIDSGHDEARSAEGRIRGRIEEAKRLLGAATKAFEEALGGLNREPPDWAAVARWAEEAAALAERAAHQSPRLAAAHLLLGRALDLLGQDTRAEQSFRRAAELDIGGAEARFALGRLLLARAYLAPLAGICDAPVPIREEGVVEDARREFEAAARLPGPFGRMAAAFAERDARRRAELIADEKKDTKWRAEVHFLVGNLDEAIQADPGHLAARVARGRARLDARDGKGAIEDFSVAIRLRPREAGLFVARGFARLQAEDHAGAVDDLSQALRLGAVGEALYTNCAAARRRLLFQTGALEDFDAALQANPQYVPAYLGRAALLAEMGRLEEALRDLNDVLRYRPDLPEGLLRRGIVLAQKKAMDEAIRDFTRAVQVKPDYIEAFLRRGSVWELQGDRAGAMRDFDEAVRLDPRCGEARVCRGEARGRAEDWAGALEDALEAVKVLPPGALRDRAEILRAEARRRLK